MKIFFSSLREHAKNIIHVEKKKMLPLLNQKLKSHQDAKVCYICGKSHFTGAYRDAAHSIWNSKLNVPIDAHVVFHNSSNYDFHFIIK